MDYVFRLSTDPDGVYTMDGDRVDLTPMRVTTTPEIVYTGPVDLTAAAAYQDLIERLARIAAGGDTDGSPGECWLADESHAMTIDELLPHIDQVLDDYRAGAE